MPKRRTLTPSQANRAPKASTNVLPDTSARENPVEQREAFSDIERAVQHASTSVETGAHGTRGEPDAAGFLEPRARGAGAP
ncbi:hypothetical protein ASE11_06680 [Hydrogenophaga sp. Root209]|uniref:hypothetical protein n=1 Tax=Hydrogenophaga sp. Root209 TaxID=1736490 RepID=UPI0006F4C132|nr:hypothetical protein [Hydrogenophaga sp. Root209]KRC01292.1 hypothetical protein ASE11_06680 [Hydrogenophaga sp. Root209]